jgi:DnaK suppressor protein
MTKEFVNSMADQLQRERRTLLGDLRRGENVGTTEGDRQPELEEKAQQERDSVINEELEQRRQDRISEIEAALARIEGGAYGECQNCGRPTEQERLQSDLTARLCVACAQLEEHRSRGDQAGEERPDRGKLPPDLDQLDDQELRDHLSELVRDDGRVDMQELDIQARNGVVYVEGAIPSESQHAMLLNILTDLAGIQEIVDHLEVQRLAWEREDRWKEEKVQDVMPGTLPNQEPAAGTEDVVLSEEEGVAYKPPGGPPPPPNRKD